jgi:hypothetical protein
MLTNSPTALHAGSHDLHPQLGMHTRLLKQIDASVQCMDRLCLPFTQLNKPSAVPPAGMLPLQHSTSQFCRAASSSISQKSDLKRDGLLTMFETHSLLSSHIFKWFYRDDLCWQQASRSNRTSSSKGGAVLRLTWTGRNSVTHSVPSAQERAGK